jgi:hypothetical protein
MGGFAGGGRGAVGIGELEPQPLEVVLELCHARGGDGLAFAGGREACARRRYRLAEQPVLLCELHLLPAPQLFPKPLVATSLRGLTLERATLLLDLEHDVVNAREVLSCGLELQLRGAAPALVLRDAGGFFDELPAVRRTGAQNLSDLPLLDDRVGLHAQPCIHQQILHVAQPARRSVDQVFALPGSIQPAHQLHVAHDERGLVLDGYGDRRELLDRAVCGELRMSVAAVPRHSVPPYRVDGGDAGGHAAQAQPDLGGRGGFPGVTATEDHVLHAIATQALGALLAKHPCQRVNHVALAAAIGADDGRHARVECELRSIRKALETSHLETIEPHQVSVPSKIPEQENSRFWAGRHSGPGSGWDRFNFPGC